MVLLKHKLLIPCERKFKKAKPGKKKLVKWPRTLEATRVSPGGVSEACTSSEGSKLLLGSILDRQEE
jgi:hypothetical protein